MTRIWRPRCTRCCRPPPRSARQLQFWLNRERSMPNGATGSTSNLHQDAERLADSSKALVTYLDDSDGQRDLRGVSHWKRSRRFLPSKVISFPELEDGGSIDRSQSGRADSQLRPNRGRGVAGPLCARTRALCRWPRCVPRWMQQTPIQSGVATVFSVDLATVLRRLAFLPEGTLARPAGLVICATPPAAFCSSSPRPVLPCRAMARPARSGRCSPR